MVSIQAVVITILEGIAVLKNGTEEFHWPLQYLPAGIKPGDTIVFKAATKEHAEQDQYTHMRRLLEEMIN